MNEDNSRHRRRRRRSTSRGPQGGTASGDTAAGKKQERGVADTPAGGGDTQHTRRRRRRTRRKPEQSSGGASATNTNGGKTTTNTTKHTKTTRPTTRPTKSGKPGRSTKAGKRSAAKRRGTPRGNQYRTHSHIEVRDETSAGGLVVSGLAEAVQDGADQKVDLSRIYVALIGRLDRRGHLLWSMPKGHVEDGEANDITAEREVWEETGIRGEVFADLGVIDYWFVSDGVRIHKTVHHHLLRYVDGDLNDEDPEVTEVAWIPADQLIEHLAYADERKLARIAHDLLPDLARAEAAAGRRTPR